MKFADACVHAVEGDPRCDECVLYDVECHRKAVLDRQAELILKEAEHARGKVTEQAK